MFLMNNSNGKRLEAFSLQKTFLEKHKQNKCQKAIT